MKKLILAVLCFSAAHAAWGSERRATLLLVPAEDFSDWKGLAGLVSANAFKITLALTPEMATPQAQDALAWLAKTGRIELAMRISGDPVLPLISASRPQDASDELALAREGLRLLSPSQTLGFVPAGGAAPAALAPALQALAVPWIAVGTTSTTVASGSHPPAFLPFTAIRSLQDLDASSGTAIDRLVLDEAGGALPPGGLMLLLRALAQKQDSRRWMTVSQSLEEEPAPPGPATDWPGWAPSPWSGTLAQASAWKAYVEAADALKHYQNSGSADLKILEDASQALYGAQSSRFYRLLGTTGPDAAEADRELRSRLKSVYRQLKQAAPASLYASLLGVSAPAGAEEATTDILSESGEGWLSFQNPAGSLSRAPADSSRSAELWKLLGLRVDWSEQSISFTYRLAAISTAASAAVLDTYIDINHIPGAGSSRLLEGREALAANRDCWEFALTLTGSGARLFRSDAIEPVFLAAAPVLVDSSSGTLKASFPRELLRGNPKRWGFIAATFAGAEDPSLPRTAPYGVEPGGPLGLLAPLEQQKAPTSRQRLNAVRLPE